MAEVIGFLRESATYGEQQTLKLLRQNLPKEYTVYVETPIHKKRDIRYPDFIILTNYGVVVLEVKDWVMMERADPDGATIRTRHMEIRHEPNPVTKARDFALTLSAELNSKRNSGLPGEAIPWSYAAVLYNLPSSVITRLRQPWGEEFVWGKDDLDIPDFLLHRLKMLFPSERMRSLTRNELDLIRSTIYPVVEIEVEGRAPFVLDPQQERIVAEPVRQEAAPEAAKPPKQAQPVQQELLVKAEEVKEAEEEKKEETLPALGERLSQNVAIRLVRGFSGSGKTLVIIQRARFLEALYPEWKIAVMTFNKPLQEQLESAFKGTSIKPRTFHSICTQYIRPSDETEVKLDQWLDDNRIDYPVIRQLGKDVVRKEIDWLRDLGIVDREAYLSLDRRGAGKDGRLVAEKREQVFEILEDYRSYLRDNGFWDWHELPLLLLEKLETGALTPEKYDAILIDEAQDWAPVWFKVINHFLEPNHGLLFLADDPSQSIYRHFSWKEKSVNVVGRTRWLRVPYRNTYEIYRAAYAMIAGNEEIQQSLSEAGELIQPEISSQEMRHGPTPLIRKCSSVPDEMEFIKNNIDTLRQDGFRDEQIAVLVRNRGDVDPLNNTLHYRGYEVKVNPIHSFKGLEMEAVILPHLQKTFLNEDNEAAERRLLYVAMSRARERLILTYSGRLPRAYEGLRDGGLADFLI